MKSKRTISLALLFVFLVSSTAVAAVTPPGTLPITDEPAELNIMVSGYTNYDLNPEVNTGMQWLQDVTGVKLNLDIVTGDDAKTSLLLSLAGDVLPDAYWGYAWSFAELQKYGMDEGAFIPMNDLIEEYCYYFKEVIDDNPTLFESMKLPDGNIYGIPDVNVCFHCSVSNKMWVNKNWMETLGLEVPQTLDEFYDMLVAFRDGDPNGNGIKDEIPMSGSVDGWNTRVYTWVLNAFTPYYPQGSSYKMYLDDGVVKSAVSGDDYREGLRYLKKLYDDGLLDPAALTQYNSDLVTLCNGEDAVVGCVPAGHSQVFLDANNYDRYSAYTTIPPREGPGGRRAVAYEDYSVANGANFVITESCRNPELAMRFVDYMFSKEYTLNNGSGLEGIAWEKLPEDTDLTTYDGSKAYCKMLDAANAAEGISAGLITDRINLRPVNYCADFFYSWKAVDHENLDVYLSQNIDYLLYDESMKVIDYADREHLLPKVMFFSSEDQEELTQLYTIADNYIQSCQVAFINGEMDLDADWQTYLDTLSSGGFDRCIELIQTAYDALQAR